MTTHPDKLEVFAQSIQSSGCIALRTVARELTRLLDEMLAPVGVCATELGILRVCAMRGPISVPEMARALEASVTMARQGIQPLLERELLIAQQQAGRRAALVQITPAGRRALLAGISCWDATQAKLKQRLGEQRWENLQRQFAAFSDLAD